MTKAACGWRWRRRKFDVEATVGAKCEERTRDPDPRWLECAAHYFHQLLTLGATSEQAAQGMAPWSWTMFPSNLDKPFKLDATSSPCRTIMLWLCVVRANTARVRSIPLEHTGVDCSAKSSASQTRTQVASILVGEINSFCLSDDKQGSMP